MKDLAVPGLTGFSSKWKAGEHFSCLVHKRIGARKVTALEEPSSKRDQFFEWLGYQSTLLRPRCEAVRAAFQLPEQTIQEVHFGQPWPALDVEVGRMAMEIHHETGEFPHAQEVMHALARSGIVDKCDYLRDLLHDDRDPAVIFANYRESLQACEEMLRGCGRSYVRVDGDVTGEARADAERRFQSGEVSTFLGQIHAASVSMNLQVARVSFTLDVSQSAIDYEQALARTCRRGQSQECIHTDLVANRLQAAVLKHLRDGANFNSQAASYLELKRALEQRQ